ncbi:unnamed protein product (macronuclear) [Paramecium tetraurelia]|uniref:TNFR-Cys domain-containing protein n=1 Tax=Paramecium tetraurelia TaxID=5888 RepID=A0C6B7_PARTE|nr:uncharacterized protein GSPATT00035463001 [Paramecium tetraurelia]CAK66334.1 unnamed protein product [Paramecium tetraurelia]|eukprot:XP_001433731.1 hypothetical protein (macronuclear) [Paramecium tetraurelia strain d4-2]
MQLLNQFILLFFFIFQQIEGQYLNLLNPLHQISNRTFNRVDYNWYYPYCLIYGFYSKYNPLSNIIQLGNIGILDSNCYHIYSIKDQTSNNINFLQYDCIDYEKKQIEKAYIFIGDDGQIYKHSYQMNIFEYESYWYFLGIIINIVEQKVVIILFQNDKEQNAQEYNIRYPFYDVNLILFCGGDLQLYPNQTLFNASISKLSYFPGSLKYYDIYYNTNKESCQISEFQLLFEDFKFACQCNLKPASYPDYIFSKLSQEQLISQNQNCDQFNFQTWIRIKEIDNYFTEIYYKSIKISGNFLNPKLSTDDLSAFQLYYRLTESINQIIITTYSYTFPSVNINQFDHPFLITKIFDIDIDIKLWHFLRVQKSHNSIQVQINFYQGKNIKEYSFESFVNHFNLVTFKIGRGNLLQSSNYFSIQFVKMVFYNCETEINLEICHLSCFECNGPTKFDCLSCDPSTNRMYNEKQNSCFCAYGKIELDGKCTDYSAFQLTISQVNKNEFKCSYGYFEYEDQCWKCPSKIRKNLITCIECITNPKTWINNPYCQYNYVTDNDNRPFTKQDYGIERNIFDGVDLKYRENQEQDQDIYKDYLQTFDHFSNFCSNCKIDVYRKKCFIFINCVECQIEISRPRCIKCVMNYKLSDGVCLIKNLIQTSSYIICQTPYYQTYYYTCILCPIENCLYCFDFVKDDIQKNTILYKFLNNIINANDQEVLVGCAQCYEGFLYDFTLQKCIPRQPQIQNCLSSFVNQQGKELCILSTIQDFTVAPQIINCQNIIQNCRQCFSNIQTILKCVICEEGYYSSDDTGLCYAIFYDEVLPKTNSVTFIRFSDQNIWRHLVQSFSLQFSQNNYPYLFTQFYLFSIECKEGYSVFKGDCIKYCDQNCQKCEYDKISERYTCSLCLLDNYNEPYKVQENGMCLICPSLCQVCQIRSDESVMSLNPNYIINKINTQYTTQCIKSISNSNVDINPYLQIAHYVYDQNQTAFEYQVRINYKSRQTIPANIIFISPIIFLSSTMRKQQFILKLEFDQPCTEQENRIINYFKAKVFSIQLLKLVLTGIQQVEGLFAIDNFNSIEFSNLLINLENNLLFQINNYGEGVDYNFQNCSFFGNQQKFVQFTIPMIINHIFFTQNVSISKVNIDNSVIFQINSTTQNENILIDVFFLMDCKMNNTTLFQFNINSKKIVIENLLIERCEFHNFTLLKIQQQTYSSKIIIRFIKIKNSIFSNSTLIDSNENNMLFIYSFQMIENQIFNSQLIRFSKDLFSFNLIFISNLFKESILFEKLFSKNYQYEVKLEDIEVSTNNYSNFQILVIDQTKIPPTQIELTNLVFQDNNHLLIEIEDYLFKFSSSNILIQNALLINTFRNRFFYLFNISQIQFKNITMQNEILKYRIPLHQDCATNTNQHSKLLFVKGFQSLYLDLIKVINQITLDQSVIEIQSNDPLLNEEFETITIQKCHFYSKHFDENKFRQFFFNYFNLFKQRLINSFQEYIILVEFLLLIHYRSIIFICKFVVYQLYQQHHSIQQYLVF